MIWTAWCNSRHDSPSASYGLRVPLADRASRFDREWNAVVVELPTKGGILKVQANVAKLSFWDPSCGELISRHFKDWFISLGLVPWPRGLPPIFNVIHVGNARFRVQLPPHSLGTSSSHIPGLPKTPFEG